jgi:hypothetical protein
MRGRGEERGFVMEIEIDGGGGWEGEGRGEESY